MGKYIWLAVTADEYELPLAVADSAKELGNCFGLSAKTVTNSTLMKYDGSVSGRKFVKVRDQHD